MAWIYLIFGLFIGIATAQIHDSSLSNPITLPPELQERLNQFNDKELEKYKSQYLEQFKKKCEENKHPELFDSAQRAATELMTCFNDLVNMEVLQKEIEEAKPTGQVDEVFKKYCVKTPEFKGCFKKMTDTVKPCFTPPEQKNFKILHNVTEQLADFICFKDGDRIALFIAEGGKECFQNKTELIQDCFNSTFDSETQENLKNITDSGMLQLDFKEKQCDQMTTLQKCVVNVLEKCPKPTSANIVDSLFNFIRKATPCKQFIKATDKAKSRGRDTTNTPGAASGLAVTTATLITALAMAMIA